MDGIKVVTGKEPEFGLPQTRGAKVALKLTGGVGDVIMALGGTANALRANVCMVDVFCMEHQCELMEYMVGVHAARPGTQWNDASVRAEYTHYVDFEGTFNTTRNLKDKPYYDLVSEKAGIPVGKGVFKFGRNEFTSLPAVCIHTGASNPNRRWDNDGWKDVAYALAAQEKTVYFLGTKEDYGFSDPHNLIIKLSDNYESLVWQATVLSHASEFIGTDSGFAHIAGVLGVPGHVIFTCTEAKNVLHMYPELVGIESGLPASRSLRVGDPMAIAARKELTVDKVMDRLELKRVQYDDWKAVQKKRKIYLTSEFRVNWPDMVKNLESVFDLLDMPGDVILDSVEKRAVLRSKDKCFAVDIRHPENLVRAVREILCTHKI